MPDALQRIAGAVLALATAPLQAALGLIVKADSPGPALYRADRVGTGGRNFVCYKLRTMRLAGDTRGPAISRGHDVRVTKSGRLLRRLRLDELPQLWNVARGEMRFVGPRPEDPRFVDMSRPLHREVFTATPGITGLTQLLYADEGRLLDGSADPETVYRSEILPAKLRIDAAYLRHRSAALDLWILARTPLAVFGAPVALPAPLAAELAMLEAESAGRADEPAARPGAAAAGPAIPRASTTDPAEPAHA